MTASNLPDGELYLGKTFDPGADEQREPFHLDPSDFTTHGLIVGMTGSGKTGLSVVTIEECLRNRIPVIIIDPKGDMTNLALAFETLAPGSFQPWIDPVAAAQEDVSVADKAASTAALWKKGLESYGIDETDVAAFASGSILRVITPGSNAGTALNLVGEFAPPPDLSDVEAVRDSASASVTALLGLLGIEADPLQGREFILLSSLLENAWHTGHPVSLETLIGLVARPPIEKLGALPLDVVYPEADRTKLMLALNNLLASPAFAAWRQGEAIDFSRWLEPVVGRTPATIVYTAHLDDAQRTFVTALLLNRLVDWMRDQPGTGNLRCLVYMDEIYGYFPPVANPPTKKPLLTLLKQARAYGVGILLATQNPVDLDYKGLANMGFWAIGRLQTTQDQQRVRQGIEAALEDAGLGNEFDDLIAAVQKRVFLVHDIHRKGPELVHSRWAMSYLRGPLTREELSLLPESRLVPMAAGGPSPAPVTARTDVPAPSPPPPPPSTSPMVLPLPDPWRGVAIDMHGGSVATPHLLARVTYRYRTGRESTATYDDTLLFPLANAEDFDDAVLAGAVHAGDRPQREPSPSFQREDVPGFVREDGPRAAERALKAHLDEALATDVLYDPDTRAWAGRDEDPYAFAERIRQSPAFREEREKLLRQVEDKRAQVRIKREEAKGRSIDKWVSIGTSILGTLSGRRRSVGSVFSKSRMENTADARADQAAAQLLELEERLRRLDAIDVSRFELKRVQPVKSDLTIRDTDIAWVS